MAFSLVLYTWSQNLMRHLHVPALVAGALTSDGKWVPSKGGLLLSVKALSKVFRAKFIGKRSPRSVLVAQADCCGLH
jgi:hypothetical protein